MDKRLVGSRQGADSNEWTTMSGQQPSSQWTNEWAPKRVRQYCRVYARGWVRHCLLLPLLLSRDPSRARHSPPLEDTVVVCARTTHTGGKKFDNYKRTQSLTHRLFLIVVGQFARAFPLLVRCHLGCFSSTSMTSPQPGSFLSWALS